MKTRIFFGAIMIAVLGGVLYLDWAHEITATTDMDWHSPLAKLPVGTLLAALMLLLAVPAFREIAKMATATGSSVMWVGGLMGTVGLLALPLLLHHETVDGMTVLVAGNMLLLAGAAVILLVFAEQMIRYGANGALGNLGATFLAMLYLGVGGAMILELRISLGAPVLVMFLATVKCTDIGAYFTGSLIGKHKMIPKISPGKSWEGLAGGLAAAVGAAFLIRWTLAIDTPVAFTVAFGVVIGVVGQFADLCESTLKRSAGVKDSGAAVPQFGGVLDILDSPLLAAPVGYVLLTFGMMPKG